jgi:hypothetical protein
MTALGSPMNFATCPPSACSSVSGWGAFLSVWSSLGLDALGAE